MESLEVEGRKKVENMQSLGTYGGALRGLGSKEDNVPIVGVLEGDKERERTRENIFKSPKFDERHLYKHSRSSVDSK